MKIIIILTVLKITQCEIDRRIITTLKYSPHRVVPVIVNGKPAPRGQMPYMVSVKEPLGKKNDKILWVPLCGGSIINKMHVLTAAHCFEGENFFYKRHPNLLRLVAGTKESDIPHSGKSETAYRWQWRKIKKLYLHPEFVFPENDIALIEVDEPWVYSETVNYAAMASKNSDYSCHCYSAGFGATSHKTTNLPYMLMRAQIDVMPQSKCSSIWQMDMSRFICTDSAVADVAFGDSGGPLGCRYTLDPDESPGRDIVVGVVSGKNYDKTSLFTRVSRYRQWIDNPSRGGDKLMCGEHVYVCVVCEHCQTPVKRQHRASYHGYSYHETCRKCYVCSETDLHNAELFKGVIFCSSCSKRIFQGCSTARRTKEIFQKTKDNARKTKETVRRTNDNARRTKETRRKTREKSPKRRSHRTKEKEPPAILAMTCLNASSDSKSSGVTKDVPGSSSHHITPSPNRSNSNPVLISAEMALTVAKPTFQEDKNIKRSSVEVGMTTEITQQLLKELNCPVVTRQEGLERKSSQEDQQKESSTSSDSTNSHTNGKSPCDLRIAELGTSREIANMALKHKNELPVIIKSESEVKRRTSTSESAINKDSDSPRSPEWKGSAYSMLDESLKPHWMDRSFRSIMKIPYFAFKRHILHKSSLVSNLISARESACVLKKMKTAFRHECTRHQKRGLKRLYSTINRKAVPNKLGWLNLVKNVYYNKSSFSVRCKHFEKSHSYRCMRAQAMQLAGPTKSELAVIRKKIKNMVAPRFVRNMALTYSKRPAAVTSQACGQSKPGSSHIRNYVLKLK